MALYDVPVHTGYKILTHTSSRRFAKNGLSQVGNRTLPTNPIQPRSVMTSAIYDKNINNLKGISEAGYGQRFPNYGLSRYAGAGSPPATFSLKYGGAGSFPSGLRYAGAGSPRASLRYAGAGSPRTSLRDAYINDNPPPGSLGKIGIKGRQNSLRGLAQDPVTDAVNSGSTDPSQNVPDPTAEQAAYLAAQANPTAGSTGFFSEIGAAFSSLLTTTTATAAQVGTTAANTAVSNAITGATTPTQKAVATVKAATNPTTVLGLSTDALLLIGIGVGAYYFMKK